MEPDEQEDAQPDERFSELSARMDKIEEALATIGKNVSELLRLATEQKREFDHRTPAAREEEIGRIPTFGHRG